tara:strand:+ start:344 stop:634 length:291 start_codon:yes stop_codon:yes gene_type:complete
MTIKNLIETKNYNVIGGPDAKAELDRIEQLGYQVPNDYNYTGGYYKQEEDGDKKSVWIAWWVSTSGEVFVEDFKEKYDAIFYALCIQVQVSDGSWK